MSENIRFERGKNPKDVMDIGDPKIRMISKIDHLAKEFGFEMTENEETSVLQSDAYDGTIIGKWERKNPKRIPRKPTQKSHNYTQHQGPLMSRLDRSQSLMLFFDEEGSDGYFVQWKSGRHTVYESAEFFLNREKWKDIFESVSFERGQDPRTAMGIGIEARLKDDDFIDDTIIEFDEEYNTAAQVYLPDDLRIELVRMILLGDYEFKILDEIDDKEGAWEDGDEYLGPEQIDQDIIEAKEEGWRTVHLEHNYDVAQAIMYRKKSVNESVNFERGQDPKAAMGVGLGANARRVKYLERYGRKNGYPVTKKVPIRFAIDILQWPSRNRRSIETSVVFEDGENIRLDNVMRSGVDLIYDGVLWVNKKSEWGSYEYVPHDLKESVSFERGKDPKEAIGIGKHSSILKDEKYKEITYPNELIEEKPWIQFSIDGKEFDEKDVIVYKYTLRYDPQRIESQTILLLWGTWLFNMNQGPYVNTVQSYIDWNSNMDEEVKRLRDEALDLIRDQNIKTNESVNFERGKDPKDSMGIGVRGRRDFPDMKSFMEWLRFMLPTILGIPENGLKDKLKVYADTDWSGTLPNDLFVDIYEWIEDAGDFKIDGVECWNLRDSHDSGSFPSIHLPGDNWTTWLLEKLESESLLPDKPLDESVNFERGRDPKDAMGIGRMNQRDFDTVEDAADWMINFSWKVKTRWHDAPKGISEDDFYLRRKWKHADVDTLILGGDVRLNMVRWMRWNIKLKGKQPRLSESKWVLDAIEQQLRDMGRIKIKE